MRLAAVVQARLASSRLPGKVVAPIRGRPMIEWVLWRARAIRDVEELVLAIPEDEEPLAAVLASPALADWVMRGSPDDVLARFAGAVGHLPVTPDAVLRITGDDPLLAPDLADHVVTVFRASEADYASNVGPGTDGLDVEVFRTDLLLRAAAEATEPYDREHVTPWIRRNARIVAAVTAPADAPPTLKLSVDTSDDLDLVRRIYERLDILTPDHMNWPATRDALAALGIIPRPIRR